MSFGPLCPQCDLSVVYWDGTDCAIVHLDCQMLSASWTTEYQTILMHSLEYVVQQSKSQIYWQGDVYITVAQRVGLDDRRHLNISS